MNRIAAEVERYAPHGLTRAGRVDHRAEYGAGLCRVLEMRALRRLSSVEA